MSIKFETEGNTVFAVAYDVLIKNYLHTEVLIAEIDPALGCFMVRFEDSWHNPIHCSTLDEAKSVIFRDHALHTPRSLGSNYYMGGK